MQLVDLLLPLLKVQTEQELSTAIGKVNSALGFTTFSASVIDDMPDGGLRTTGVDNMPQSYQQLFTDPLGGRADPALQHAKTSSIPVLWGQAYYVANGQGEKWENQAANSLSNGVVIASHRGTRHFCLGVDSSVEIPHDPRVHTTLLADVSLFCAYAQDAAIRVLKAGNRTMPASALTAREVEVLKWTSVGKTAWEVSVILGIGEGTVTKFLRSAQIKLDGSNKAHAVATALRLGVII